MILNNDNNNLSTAPQYNILENKPDASNSISQAKFVTKQSPTLELHDQRKGNCNDKFGEHDGPTPTPPVGFKLSPYTVIVGKGKEPNENLGNKRLRVLASTFLERYSSAKEKHSKSEIIMQVIHMIHDANGQFVKHTKDGRWYQVDEAVAREKVSYVFRDLLGDKYRSSSKSRVAQRRNDGKPFAKLEMAMSTYSIQKVESKSIATEPVVARPTRSNSILRTLPPFQDISFDNASFSDTVFIINQATSLILNDDDDDFDVNNLLLSPTLFPL